MLAFLGLLSFAAFIAMIVGLIKPSLILKKSKKPTRLKIFGLWILSTFIVGILTIVLTGSEQNSDTIVVEAEKLITDGKFKEAKEELQKINSDDSLYNRAQLIIIKADSLSRLTNEEKVKYEEQLAVKKKEEEIEEQKEQLKRELKSINEGIEFAKGKNIEALQMDLVLFASWAKIIEEAKNSDNLEIQNLGKKLSYKVSNIQTKEFPNLRKKYSKFLANKMWENDIYISASGTGKRYINLTGGIFAANKNKKDFQETIHEILTMFRFKQSRYRWYKGAEEFTYYDVYKGKDSDPVIFDGQ